MLDAISSSFNAVILRLTCSLLLTWVSLGSMICGALAQSAQGEVFEIARLEPSGIDISSTGKEIRFSAIAKFPVWPVDVWCSSPHIQIIPLADYGRFRVQISENAEPGRFWLRFYQGHHVSNPTPLIVSFFEELSEREPNDAIEETQTITPTPSNISGVLQKRGDVDQFRVQAARGEQLIASVDANRSLNSPLDAVLQIVDIQGNVLAQNIDYHGLDPHLVFTIPNDGDYIVRVFGYPAAPDSTIGFVGGDTYRYRLTITRGAFLEATVPLDLPADTPTQLSGIGWNLPADAFTQTRQSSTASPAILFAPRQSVGFFSVPVRSGFVAIEPQSPLSLPAYITGCVRTNREVDRYTFQAKKETLYRMRIDSRSLGFPLDPTATLLDSNGKVLQKYDDQGDQVDPQWDWKAPADGLFTVEVADRFATASEMHWYRLSITEPQPTFEALWPAATFSGKAGEWIEAKVSVKRLDGYNGEIQFKLVDPPAGLIMESTSSKESDATAKEVLLKFRSERPWSGAVQVQASGEQPVAAQNYLFHSETSLPQVWLSISP